TSTTGVHEVRPPAPWVSANSSKTRSISSFILRIRENGLREKSPAPKGYPPRRENRLRLPQSEPEARDCRFCRSSRCNSCLFINHLYYGRNLFLRTIQECACRFFTKVKR